MDQVRALATMITELTGQDLLHWMAAVREDGLPVRLRISRMTGKLSSRVYLLSGSR